jgi:hypothetical protein
MDPLRLIAGEQPGARQPVVRRLAGASCGGLPLRGVRRLRSGALNARAFSRDNKRCAKHWTLKTPNAIVKKK